MFRSRYARERAKVSHFLAPTSMVKKIIMNDLRDKICVITGAGKGFGLDLAKKYQNLGSKLALITRSADDVVSLRSLFADSEADVLIFEGDVSEPNTVEIFKDAVLERFKTVDVLINNAGMI